MINHFLTLLFLYVLFIIFSLCNILIKYKIKPDKHIIFSTILSFLTFNNIIRIKSSEGILKIMKNNNMKNKFISRLLQGENTDKKILIGSNENNIQKIRKIIIQSLNKNNQNLNSILPDIKKEICNWDLQKDIHYSINFLIKISIKNVFVKIFDDDFEEHFVNFIINENFKGIFILKLLFPIIEYIPFFRKDIMLNKAHNRINNLLEEDLIFKENFNNNDVVEQHLFVYQFYYAFFFASFNNIPTILWYLSTNNDIQNNVRINNIEYTKKVIYEILRIITPVSIIGREYNNINFSLYLNEYNNNEKLFNDPYKINVNRNNINKTLTFGLGNRKCPAEKFIINFYSILIKEIISTFKITSNKNFRPKWNINFIRYPINIKEINLCFTKLEKTEIVI